MLPDDALDALLKMSDKLIADKKTKSHGKSLAELLIVN